MTLYSGILARIEALGPRPDIATLDAIDRTLETVFNAAPVNGGPVRSCTRSLDAALALVERSRAATGIDAAQMLHEALEDLANGGWRDDRPIAPQIALALLAAMLRALSDGVGRHRGDLRGSGEA